MHWTVIKEKLSRIFKSINKILTKNIYNDNDPTFKSLTNLWKNKNVVLSADKESCTVILSKADYINKINKMIDEGIANGKHIETSDTTHVDLKYFQDLLYRSLKE